ncbi:hypothetical protein LTR37_003927 [Vermiconidia calcicola]|uniref:Uncharacterized protein n=1 Tax=Vermiconidia calcicola TaxID=1690605 RepID=A0ACC3NNR3_9PEZI|nr:hypothetical protein LTR37_003927 [Vermiconidia calcicola]
MASARFSTYSGAPSLQPSLAPTMESSSNRSARTSQATNLSPQNLSEKSRGSVYGSTDTTAQASTSTLGSNDPKSADLKSWCGALERMQDKRLEQQRYTMSRSKSDEVSKLALGAKVERALSRRMSSQDATFKVKKPLDREKRNWEIEAN